MRLGIVLAGFTALPPADFSLRWEQTASGPGGTPSIATTTARVGFVVSKAVGTAVTRNRVKRRLRHLPLPSRADVTMLMVPLTRGSIMKLRPEIFEIDWITAPMSALTKFRATV